jgi:FKBP-type peptidyl-prolyl cis-trans isomerase 2
MARRKMTREAETKKPTTVRKREIEKIAKIDKRKEIEIKKEIDKRSRGIPLLYAVAIFVIVAVIVAIFIYITPAGAVVKKGDFVLVYYTGELENGEIFDSGNFTFNAGMGQAISGFDQAVIGMSEGETKRIEIPPDQAYGEYDPNMIIYLPLVDELNITANTTAELFNLTFGEPPVVGQSYVIEGMEWPIRIVDIYNETVVEFVYEAEDGQIIYRDYGVLTVEITGNAMKITTEPKIGAVISTIVGNGRITEKNETHMTLDFNHELAGKNLIFTVTVLKILSV